MRRGSCRTPERRRPPTRGSARMGGRIVQDSSMSLTPSQRAGIFLILALVMTATRVNHFAALPDASWAVFFVGGFYLSADRDAPFGWFGGGSVRWAFPILMALAVLIDFVVITSLGIDFWSHYCVSIAYWFLLPAYFAMWLG